MRKLHSILTGSIVCILPMIILTAGKPPVKTKAGTKVHFTIDELTKHQWTIVEYKETINDTARNLTLTMMPCEKDKVLKYDANKTYLITDKCSSKQGDETGTWAYDETDNTISQKFSGGTRISKKIVSLDEGMLHIEYEGEKKKKISIIYLSEVGKKDESKKDEYVDNGDPVSIITQMIKDNIDGQDKYLRRNLSDFYNGVEKKSVSKQVVVVPLMNNANRPADYDPKGAEKILIEMGKKAGIDFIVTGVLISCKTTNGPDNKPVGNINYSVKVLNVKKGKETFHDEFIYPGESHSERSTRKLTNTLRIIGAASAATSYTPYPYYYGHSYYYGNNSRSLSGLYYSTYAARQAANSASYAYGAYSFYSNGVSQEERNSYFASSLSMLQSIEMTQPDLKAFLEKKIL